jgi:hypothetical protein
LKDNWQITKRRRRKPRADERVYVSLNKRGEIAMNARAFKLIREPANVTLMFDPTHRRIGVKFPVTQDRDWFPVRRYGRGRKMRIVRAWRLLQQFEIEITETLRFVNPAIETFKGDPMIVLPVHNAKCTMHNSNNYPEACTAF